MAKRSVTYEERFRIRNLVALDEGRRNRDFWDKTEDAEDWFRETHNRRLKHRPILKGQKETAIVEFLAAWFQTSRFSRFQYEGEARVALRLMFLKQGYSWQRCDDEAWRLTQAALHHIGAVRPPKEEGQPEWTLEEWCGFCHGPLDDEAFARRDRYCCSECAKMALTKRAYGVRGYSGDYFGGIAYRQVRRETMPAKTCENCNRPFWSNVATKTLWDKQRFCSPQCRNASARVVPDQVCENPKCGKTFRPRGNGFKYCSRECAAEGHSALLDMRNCILCGSEFQPKRNTSRYCGSKCRNLAPYYRRKAEAAKQTDPESAVGKLFDEAA